MRILATTLCILIAACAVQQERPSVNAPPATIGQIDALRSAFPGVYSNFAQVHAAGTGGPVTEAVIRQLTADREAAFLISRKFREGEVNQHQLYWFTAGSGPDVIEARFAPLGEAELALPLPRILDEAAARFRPGCELIIASTTDGLTGQTNAETCRFEHPEAGDVGLLREFNFGRGKLHIAERLLDTNGNRVGEDGVLELQKHRRFRGWAGIQMDSEASADDPGAWRLASSFELADDGHVEPLVDAAGDMLDFGLQLARIRWRADQPPILRLAVIRLSTGKIQAYAWSEPGSHTLGINLDWFQAGLEFTQ
jgi:hypothetical protein